jgi:hypothetical protein
MNDNFLYESRPGLRNGFADELYAKISNDKSVFARFRHFSDTATQKLRLGTAIALGIVVIVACAHILLEPRNVQVGTIWVQEGDDTLLIPKGWGWSPSTEATALSSPPVLIPIDEAVELLPYRLKIPVWTPDDFSLSSDVVWPPTFPVWTLSLNWSDSQNNYINLFVHQGEGGEIRVPRGAWKEVSVNGLPAVLVRGNFPWRQMPPPESPEWETGVELTWDKNAGIRLIWNQGGARYQLEIHGDYLDEDDLIRMAESMRTW